MPYLQPRNTPFRLTAMTRSNTASSVSTTEPSSSGKIPALLNSTCRAPKRDSAKAIMPRASSLRDTSAAKKAASPPRSATASTVARPAFSTASTTTTRAPSAAKASAEARPIPPPAPVIRATLFSNRPMVSPLKSAGLRCAIPRANNETTSAPDQPSSITSASATSAREEARLERLAELHLRMPLDADAPRLARVLDRLDHAVLRPRHRLQPRSRRDRSPGDATSTPARQ